jgi:hypothetical protein
VKKGAKMRKSDYKKMLIEQTQQIGTYKEAFLPAIDTLAGILEQRDKTHREFTASGGKAVITHTNKAGATNMERNPALLQWESLNSDALQYWRDLGLTPAGLKKIDEKLMKPQKKSTFESLLSGLDKE